MQKHIFYFLFILSSALHAQTQEKVAEELAQALNHSRKIRSSSEYFGIGTYSPLDLILPSKLGLTFGKNKDADHTWELEYLRSSVSVPFIVDDLGAMTDERLSWIKRNYYGSEIFNFSYGLSYHRFSLNLGNKYLSSVTSVPNVELIEIESLGFNLGIGNRWIFENKMILGVEWFSWAQPVFKTKYNNSFKDYVTNADDQDTVDKGVKLISYLPRFAILKLQLGYSF